MAETLTWTRCNIFRDPAAGRSRVPLPAASGAVACLLLVLLGATAEAQEGRGPSVDADRSELALPTLQSAATARGARFRWTPSPDVLASIPVAQDAPAPAPRRGARRIILGAAVGAVGGFFAGGYTGAAIEGDSCHCDDPGLKGALIGAPIGAALGGIAGGKWLF